MKKICFLIGLLPLLGAAQPVFTVSNIPGVKATYSTLQGAVDSSAAGSTLIVFPSATSYGTVVLTRKMAIYGNGYLLDQNSPPFIAPNTSGVIMNNIVFRPGSDNSYVEGLSFMDMTYSGPFTTRIALDSVSNVTVSRCLAYMRGFGPPLIITNTTYNCTIKQCYFVPRQPDAGFDASGGNYFNEAGANGSQNLLFANNIFDPRSGGDGGPFYFNTSGSTITFRNNTFVGGLSTSQFGNYTYVNNLFVNQSTHTLNSNLYLNGANQYNVSTNTGFFPGLGNNYENANADSVFVYSQFGYHSFEGKWMVQAGSFAKTFADDGGEVGAFGGATPYVLSGIPNLPAVYAVSIQRDTSARGHVLVHIQGKASY